MIAHHVNDMRGRIAALQAERKTLEDYKFSRKETREKVERQVASWTDEAQKHASNALLTIAVGRDSANLRADVSDSHASQCAKADLGPLLTALLGTAKVTAFLLADIDAIPEGLDRADRAARLAAIAVELDDLERQEEALIEDSEAAGVLIARRADARPDIVLGAKPAPVLKPYVSEVTDSDPYASKRPVIGGAVASSYLQFVKRR